MEYKEYASKGVAGAGLGLGIAGTALGLLGGGSALLNGWNPRYADGCCSENHVVTRYEAEQAGRIARLEGELANKNAEIYTDKKSLELYQYIDGRLRGIEGQLAQQAVYNATNNGLIDCLRNQVAVLQGMTKTVIPDDNICPQPMQRYNSWTAPTAAAAGASTGG